MLTKKVRSLSLDSIKIQDPFWKEYMELIRNHVIPYQWDALNDRIKDAEPSYCIQNFRVAAGQEQGKFQGMVFQDSDLYKWLEAVAYSLMWHPDAKLEKTADDAIELMGAVQQPDGYLDTYYIINGLEKRFTNLMDNHEMYCLGHMVEAAVAYYKATGKRELLDISIKFVDCAIENLGLEDGKKPGYPGHEVAEMALMALYDVTKDQKHLDFAKYLVDQRGQEPLYFEKERRDNENNFHWEDSYFQMQYYQAGIPVREQKQAQGHAVRAVYLYSGMADVAAQTQDKELFDSCKALWDNIEQRQMYITGAIGSSQYGEAFTFDYDLPNDTIYAETCASIGLIFFARRMFEITKDSKYVDVMEQALYNGVISGMSLDGTKFFYVNPLEVLPEASEKDHLRKHVKVERQKWFGCACCPPNVARLVSSIGSYAFAQDDNTLYVNLFIGGEMSASFGGNENKFTVETDYPWLGEVKLTVNNSSPSNFHCAVRIPAWCEGKFAITVNGENAEYSIEKGYAVLDRTWNSGDCVVLTMDMPVRQIMSNPRVRQNIGKIAVTRGPVVYCLEQNDNGEGLTQLYVPQNTKFIENFERELFNGVVTLTAEGKRLSGDNWNEDELYKPYSGQQFSDCSLKFIPYYTWANRSAGEMLVWVHSM